MNRTGITGSALGTTILAFLLFRGMATPPGAQDTSGVNPRTGQALAQKHAKAVASEEQEGPWTASREHYAGQFKSTDEGCRGGKGRPNPRLERWCIPDAETTQAMIAFVPDPIHTHLALVFDRSLDALLLAAGTMGYVVDRFWLPWEPGAKTDWSDYASNKSAVDAQKIREDQPGLLMFRKSNGQTLPSSPQMLYVFLVADTPTSGIDGEQFGHAVEYAKEVSCNASAVMGPRNATGCGPQQPIDVMGPTFSGSLASFRRLVQSKQPQKFRAVSGTVSSACAIEKQGLKNQDQPEPWDMLLPPCSLHNPGANELPLSNLEFQSLMVPNELAIPTFLRGLPNEGACRTAIFSEAGTVYGHSSSYSQVGPGKGAIPMRGLTMPHEPGSPPDGGEPNNTKDTAKDKAQEKSCYTVFLYPREISQLRNAYQRLGNDAASADAKNNPSARPFLSLNLADPSNRSDEPRDFSESQGPTSKEAILMGFAATLRRNRYDYIGITGTNVLDILFLGNFLRSACPDARLFMFNSDLLFEREIDNAPYLGMLAVAPYPLFDRYFDWLPHHEGERRLRLPFADHFQEGQYNATIAALEKALTVGEAEEKQLGNHGNRLPAIEPPALWLTAVGTGGHWPIRLLWQDPSKPALTQHLTLDDQDFSNGWKVLETLLCGIALLHIWIVLTASPASRFRDFILLPEAPSQRVFFLHFAAAALALALAMMVAPAWKFNRSPGFDMRAIRAIGPVLVAALLLTSVHVHGTYLRRLQYRSVWKASAGSLIVWASAAVLGCFWWRLFAEDWSHYGFFFAYRSVNLSTGVSPIPPVLLLLGAIYLWSMFEILRLRFNDHVRPRLNMAEENAAQAVTNTLQETLEDKVARSVNSYLLRLDYVVICAVIFAIWLFSFDPVNPFHLFEQNLFGVVYEVLFCLLVAVMLSGGFRLAQIWSSLRQLLFSLERSHLRYVFMNFKGASWSPLWQQGGIEQEWISMARSMETIQQAKVCYEEQNSRIESDLEDLREETQEIRRLLRIDRAAGAAGTATQAAVQYVQSWDATTPLRRRIGDVKEELETIQHALGREAIRPSLDAKLTSIQTRLAEIQEEVGSLNDLAPVRARLLEAAAFVGDQPDDVKEMIAQLRLRKLPENLSAEDRRRYENPMVEIQDHLGRILSRARDLLSERWKRCGGPEANAEGSDQEDDQKKETRPPTEMTHPSDRPTRYLEEYVALRYIAFIRNVLLHVRYILIFLGASFSLALMSLNIYSFQPHQALVWSFTAIFAVLGYIVVTVMMQVHRNTILSRITGTKPNELGIEFYLRLVAFGLLPLLTLLATHFPSIGRYLLSFLQPGLEALK